jgi:hypothetical protein
MKIYQVQLMNKKTFEGKKVMVSANSNEVAETRARQLQHKTGGMNVWAALVSHVQDATGRNVTHPGLLAR